MDNIYLGINVSHGASAALMINGKIVKAYQEERFNKIKNFVGYPKQSIDACIKFISSKKKKINCAGFSTFNNNPLPYKYPLEHLLSIKEWINYYGKDYYQKIFSYKQVDEYYKFLEKKLKKKKLNLYIDYSKINKKNHNNSKLFREIQKQYLLKQSKGIIQRIEFIDHHTCHAYYATYSLKIKEPKLAVVTLDSEGDEYNQTLWMYNKNNKIKLKKILASKECDLARIYKFVTLILKMKPNEHEYKVMGLAPYAKKKYSKEIEKDVFSQLLKIKNCKIIHNKRPKDLFGYLMKSLEPYRFDNIAAATQNYIEEMSKKLFLQINKKYKIKNFSLSGGVSMNIKMNKSLSELNFLKKLYVSPTGTDESLSIGACYYLSRDQKKYPISNIYLGQELDNKEIELNYLYKFFNKKNYIIEKSKDFKIAQLLSKGEIIAVARDCEEFGARALGNRSILANPFKDGVIQEINEMIKNRDFWMPFALTILKKHHKKYIKNFKNLNSDFMTLGFDIHKSKFNELKNGTHQYDKTVRPQILSYESNPRFYNIIEEFYKITNVPAVLNTSLNLHGMPISSTLSDVFYTFKNSSLKFLSIDDKYLIKKKII